MFKTVSLPAETWAKITRRLTAEVGADDASRVWAGAITEQTSGAVKAAQPEDAARHQGLNWCCITVEISGRP